MKTKQVIRRSEFFDKDGLVESVEIQFSDGATVCFGQKRSDETRTLLDEAAECLGDRETAPNDTWWRRYFLLAGYHMILTDEGWEHGSAKDEYKKQAEEDGVPLSDFIHDEVYPPLEANAPAKIDA